MVGWGRELESIRLHGCKAKVSSETLEWRCHKKEKDYSEAFYFSPWCGDGFRVPAAVESVFPRFGRDVGTRIQRRHVNFPPRIHSLFGDTVTKVKTFKVSVRFRPIYGYSCSSLIERLPVVFHFRASSRPTSHMFPPSCCPLQKARAPLFQTNFRNIPLPPHKKSPLFTL